MENFLEQAEPQRGYVCTRNNSYVKSVIDC